VYFMPCKSNVFTAELRGGGCPFHIDARQGPKKLCGLSPWPLPQTLG
jgi:hypothetical protein